MTKDLNKNANDMGGPSFHPDIGIKEKAPGDGNSAKKENKGGDGAILRKDQVPPL